MMKTGYVHSVETLGTVDNGGIRFVLFLQGCALQCRFCHNPDTWLRRGNPVTVSKIIEQLKDYKPFFDLSGGGLTVSGGEPLLQPDFVKEVFIEAGKLEIHRALDTSGFCRHGNIISVLPYTDLVMFSIKAVDEEKHRKLTNRGNAEILENLRLAVDSAAELVISYVLIPEINNSSADARALSELVSSLPSDVPIQVLPYHKMGTVKWEQMGMDDPMAAVPPATPAEVQSFQDLLRGAEVRVY